MAHQVGRSGRRAAAAQVGRRGAHQPLKLAQLARDPARVAELAEAQREVDSLFDEIDQLVVDLQPQGDSRVGVEQAGQRLRDVPCKADRR